MTHMDPNRRVVRRHDYRAPSITTTDVDLHFALDPDATIVTATLGMHRINENSEGSGLWLDGDDLDLLSIAIDGTELAPSDFERSDHGLTIHRTPDHFELQTKTRIAPARNTQLSGLYLSSGNFCTQCEAQGFRRITYFQDRPDVMARYQVTIEAAKQQATTLLSNGNLIETTNLENGRHRAIWQDPFPKPSYLFALVAGNFALLEDSYTTMSGRQIVLRIYSEQGTIDQCGHAIESLKKSMRWDEERFGLEYDLDLYQIVAVGDFNAGAMENKGLNVFNTSLALAKAETATDQDFNNVERVIAHEYFHNWTGNRVTCRDWFQLTLKEGLTVFRDQIFAEDMHSPGVKRIDDVALLRESQFAEDSSPLAHPVRPDSYIEISNFYTRAVYEKGAEVIRMIHTLLGEENFRKGMDLYFMRFDGQAVTCDDFVDAMQDASGVDLAQFRIWYEQAGTPKVSVKRSYDAENETYSLEITQSTPPTPGQSTKKDLHIPIRIGLLRKNGVPLRLQLQSENTEATEDRLIELKDAQASLTFINVPEEPVPSLLRNFSAPIIIDCDLSKDELAILFSQDRDQFNRWEAGQRLATQILLESVNRPNGKEIDPTGLVDAFRQVLNQSIDDPAFHARLIRLPSKSYLAQQMGVIDVDRIHHAMERLRAALGTSLAPEWRTVYERSSNSDPASLDRGAMGQRALRNAALRYLLWDETSSNVELAKNQYHAAGNMTDRMGALSALVWTSPAHAQDLLEDFYDRFQHDPLVVNKWFSLQAMIEDANAPERVENLMKHEAYTDNNPNRLRSLIGAFAMGNIVGFNNSDGAGYRLLCDVVLRIDSKNPQIAARLLTALGRWRRYDHARQALMKAELERILAHEGLSRDSYEIARKSVDG